MAGIQHFYRFLWSGLDWLFPPVCGGCKQVGFRWCPQCRHDVIPVPDPVCPACGIPVARAGECPSCCSSRLPYQALRSWLVYDGPIRKAIHSLKYRRNVALGDALAEPFAEYASRLGWRLDWVTAIPSGRKRMSERGYNQAALLTRPLAAYLGTHYSTRIVIRSRETASQVGLSPSERKANVAGAFSADPRLVSGRNIMLVDDVATTGATLASCAEALLHAGASNVYALTLARALPHHGFEIV